MNEVTVANFRCFREKQAARLAPLTLLIGENSTGKTSFLALMRVLWDVAYLGRFPDFKEPPYDLGIFDEIAHFRGGRGGRATEFQAGFSLESVGQGKRRSRSLGAAGRTAQRASDALGPELQDAHRDVARALELMRQRERERDFGPSR